MAEQAEVIWNQPTKAGLSAVAKPASYSLASQQKLEGLASVLRAIISNFADIDHACVAV